MQSLSGNYQNSNPFCFPQYKLQTIDMASYMVETQQPEYPRIFRPWETSPRTSTYVNNTQEHKAYSQITSTTPSFITSQIQVHDTPNSPASDVDIKFNWSLHDSGIHSDRTNSPVKSRCTKRALNSKAVELMEQWYRDNVHHPYPSHQVIRYLANAGDIAVTQIKKWMANKRVRSCNTLSMNGSPHPNRMKKLQKNVSNIHHRKSPTQYTNKFAADLSPTAVTLPHHLSLPL